MPEVTQMLEMEPDSAGHHTTQQASLSHPGQGSPWADPLPFPDVGTSICADGSKRLLATSTYFRPRSKS